MLHVGEGDALLTDVLTERFVDVDRVLLELTLQDGKADLTHGDVGAIDGVETVDTVHADLLREHIASAKVH